MTTNQSLLHLNKVLQYSMPKLPPSPPINFLKPSSTPVQLFSFTASAALVMLLLVKMATGCMVELSLHLYHSHLSHSPR